MRLVLLATALLGCASLAVGISGCGGSKGGGPASNWPPPIHDACTAPDVTAGVSLPTTRAVTSVALAWSGGEAAVIYVEEAMASLPILQRLDHHGNPLGDAIHLSADDGVPFMARTSVLSDGDGFLTCWEHYDGFNSTVNCASVLVGGSMATSGFAPVGSMGDELYHPVLAYDGASRVVEAQQGGTGVLHLLDPMAADASMTPTQIDRYGMIAARSPGFVVATGGPPSLRWSEIPTDGSSQGTSQTNPANLQLLDIAATPHTAVVLARGVGSSGAVQVLTLGPSTSPVALDDTSGYDSSVGAITRGASSFAAAWVTDSAVRYRALGGDGTPKGSPVDLSGLSGDLSDLMGATARPAMALVAVDDGFLLATVNASGLVITHLGCP